MRKDVIVTLLALLLLPVASYAQVVGGGPVIGGGGSGGTGDVVGPASALDNEVARYDTTTGKLLQAGSLIKILDATDATNINLKNASGTLAVQNDGALASAISVGSQSWIDSGANRKGIFFSGKFSVSSDYQIGFSSSTSEANNIDTGLARVSAGVVKVTDGSTGIRSFLGGGAAVASATALPVPTGRVFHVTGTTTITSITSTNFQSGACVSLIFDDALTFTDGSNLKLAGDFVTTADDTISLCYDGTNWYETARSVN